MSITVIADMVGSRRLVDREHAQQVLDRAISRVQRDLPVAERELTPTVGDEQQGVYPSLDAALASTLLLQLALPDGIECRFGVGVGSITTIESRGEEIPEGPGWWAARAAIDAVHVMQRRAAPSARTWIAAAAGEDDSMIRVVSYANAYLLVRDQLVGAMTERGRRLTYGRCLGTTQRDLATAEGITQSAVSQGLAAAGSAAIVAGFATLARAATA